MRCHPIIPALSEYPTLLTHRLQSYQTQKSDFLQTPDASSFPCSTEQFCSEFCILSNTYRFWKRKPTLKRLSLPQSLSGYQAFTEQKPWASWYDLISNLAWRPLEVSHLTWIIVSVILPTSEWEHPQMMTGRKMMAKRQNSWTSSVHDFSPLWWDITIKMTK